MGEYKGKEVKGRVKEATGALTGDKELRAKGMTDQGEAKVRRGWDDLKETVKGEDDRTDDR